MRGLTAAELADRAKTFQSTISRMEAGRQAVTLEWLYRIAEALEVQPADLLVQTGPRLLWVVVVGDLRRSESEGVMLDHGDRNIIPCPIKPTSWSGDSVEAFRTGEQSWLVCERRLPQSDEAGKMCVVARGADFAELRKFEYAGDGRGGFSMAEGPPEHRWVPLNHLLIERVWVPFAELSER